MVGQGTQRAILSLGSNMGDRASFLERAITAIGERCGAVVGRSQIYEARALPVPNVVQSNFLNMILHLETRLTPAALLNELLAIEGGLGRERTRGVRWGPRVIDIDIIDYGGIVSKESDPILPHPRYKERDFVLIPLLEVFQNFKDAESGVSADVLLERIPPGERCVINVSLITEAHRGI